MRTLSRLAARINPPSIYAFVDRVQLWLPRPLPRNQMSWLARKSGGPIHVEDRPMRFNPYLTQRLQIYQPSWHALQSLATLDCVLLNYVEISLDWIFHHEVDRNEAYWFACWHHIKQRHREQLVKIIGPSGTSRYSGPRRAPNVLAVYCDRPSKITGELCCHFDWRIKGVNALRRAGIASLGDLLNLNCRQFWRDRLLMKEADLRELGRMYHTHIAAKGRRRAPWIAFIGRHEFPYDVDLRAGATIMRALGSTQAVIDQYRKRMPVSRCLNEINIDHLLPQAHLYDYANNLDLTHVSR
jgi:hypothetical protein